jgi:CRP-like cAMP-binding protein/Fe-S-cluster-containing hydrogenase component 2/thioredoxin reductase
VQCGPDLAPHKACEGFAGLHCAFTVRQAGRLEDGVDFKIVIVGGGPGGLSASARAVELGLSHVLLEASADIANTVRRFQKGKLVMSEPAQVPLRSSLSFLPGTREKVLETWQRELQDHGINLRTEATVSAISGHQGDFRITLASGERLTAEFVVLAIGLQGNIRKLEIPGADLPCIQYQLDDPEEYCDETIVVIGGGDAGVENALALAVQNQVILINKQDGFSACREANFDRLEKAVAAGRLTTRTSTSPVRIEHLPEREFPLSLVVQSAQGLQEIKCHRIIARIGATPPRQTLERFGVGFSNSDLGSVPQLSEHYESNVHGLYIIGSLAGYPLIKQAMNQGYEVVEFIAGNPIEPADQSILLRKFSQLPGTASVANGIELIRRSQPLLASLTTLQLREFMLDSDIRTPRPGELIFRANDYGNSFFSILQGTVQIHIESRSQDEQASVFSLSGGDFFGEIGLLSGRRRTGTVVAGKGCVLVETPRRTMLNLIESVPSVQRLLDEVSLKRAVRNCFGAALGEGELNHLVHQAKLRRYAVGEIIFNEGDEPDALYMIRRGSVTVSRRVEGREVVAAYVSAGNYIGEMALVSKAPRAATVRASAPTEAVLLEANRFSAILAQNPTLYSELAGNYLKRVHANELPTFRQTGELVRFLVNQGIGEATDVLLIDNSKCIRCFSCELACADVHGGTSRLNRDAGRTHEMIHVPASCRHCEHPRCMQDCPPDAIRRSSQGEVFISESCIGCGNCQSSCTYGVIQMASKSNGRRSSLWDFILGRSQRRPFEESQNGGPSNKMAIKCDMCIGIVGGAACVRACPTGAAVRVNPDQFLAIPGK